MPELLTFEHEHFPSALNWQAVSFMRVEWPFIDGGLLRQTYPAEDRPTHFAVVEDGLLLSYAAVIRVPIRHAGEEYDARGLGSVFTFPSSRRQGHGRRVVDAATRHIRDGGADLAALFTGPDLKRFYSRSGWEAQEEAKTLTGNRDAPDALDALRMMLFVSEKGKAARRAFETEPLYLESAW